VQQVKFNKYPSFVGMNIKATIDLASMVLVVMGNASQTRQRQCSSILTMAKNVNEHNDNNEPSNNGITR
jgi:hypothetical protein